MTAWPLRPERNFVLSSVLMGFLAVLMSLATMFSPVFRHKPENVAVHLGSMGFLEELIEISFSAPVFETLMLCALIGPLKRTVCHVDDMLPMAILASVVSPFVAAAAGMVAGTGAGGFMRLAQCVLLTGSFYEVMSARTAAPVTRFVTGHQAVFLMLMGGAFWGAAHAVNVIDWMRVAEMGIGFALQTAVFLAWTNNRGLAYGFAATVIMHATNNGVLLMMWHIEKWCGG